MRSMVISARWTVLPSRVAVTQFYVFNHRLEVMYLHALLKKIVSNVQITLILMTYLGLECFAFYTCFGSFHSGF